MKAFCTVVTGSQEKLEGLGYLYGLEAYIWF
jgi:hypothetical protein